MVKKLVRVDPFGSLGKNVAFEILCEADAENLNSKLAQRKNNKIT